MKSQREEETLIEPEFPQSSIQAYTLFRDRIYNPRSVFYPCCSADASPSRVFGNITFLDRDKAAIDALKRIGLGALAMDIEEYNPVAKHDLLLLMNPAISPELATPHLVSGGYVIANDYHSTATDLNGQRKFFELIAAMKLETEEGVVKIPEKMLLITDLEGFFEPVKSFEELKQLRPGEYKTLAKMIPHLLSYANKKVEGTLEDQYRQHRGLLHQSTELPAKKIAEYYVFRKK